MAKKIDNINEIECSIIDIVKNYTGCENVKIIKDNVNNLFSQNNTIYLTLLSSESLSDYRVNFSLNMQYVISRGNDSCFNIGYFEQLKLIAGNNIDISTSKTVSYNFINDSVKLVGSQEISIKIEFNRFKSTNEFIDTTKINIIGD